MRDLRSSITAAHSLAPAVRNASANGAGVDLRTYESAVAVVHFGAYTDGSHTAKLQESSDDSTYTDVAAADLIGAFTAVAAAGGANTVQIVGYNGSQRYIRVVMTISGATTGAASSGSLVRGNPRHIGVTA